MFEAMINFLVALVAIEETQLWSVWDMLEAPAARVYLELTSLMGGVSNRINLEQQLCVHMGLAYASLALRCFWGSCM